MVSNQQGQGTTFDRDHRKYSEEQLECHVCSGNPNDYFERYNKECDRYFPDDNELVMNDTY